MKLPSFMRQTSDKRVDIIVSLCLIIAFFIQFVNVTLGYIENNDRLNGYEYSEFLINFQGGFVRRGLVGEILWELYSIVDYPIELVLTIVSYGAFFFVIIFFFRQFYKKGYCWWLLLSPLFLGFVFCIVRKDYLLYAMLIGILYTFRSTSNSIIKHSLACLGIILGLFLHEAFIFWGFPVYALLMLSYDRNKFLNNLLVLFPIMIFFILCIYKGSAETASTIVKSWNSLLKDSTLTDTFNNSIGALGWNSRTTFLTHLKRNASLSGGYGNIVLLPIFVIVAYFMFTNFLMVFNKKSKSEINKDKLTLSLLYSLSMFCLIPMLTILSCDTGRVFQYAAVATFSTFLIIPHNKIISAFPRWYVLLITRFNTAINNFLPPCKGLLIILLLFIGMSPAFFGLYSCWTQSVIWTICDTFITLLKSLTLCFIH